MQPLDMAVTCARIMDHHDDLLEARIRVALGKGLYPTAWGGTTPQEWWQLPCGQRTLRHHLDIAFGNIRRFILPPNRGM